LAWRRSAVALHSQIFHQCFTVNTSRGEIDDRRMAASDTKESMMLCYTVTVNGQSLCSYEDVRNFVKTIDPRFYDTFGQLFPTSLAFDKYDYIAKFFSVDEREKAFDFYRSQYNLDVFGAMMCSVLRYCTNNSPPRSISNSSGRRSDDEMSDVYSFPSKR
jgi:hypothetical protein